MKNKTLSLLGILVAFLFLFSACEKSAIEEAQENYDYDKTIPDIIGGISGETSVIKTNTKKYSLGYFRGGSTWAWTATGAEVQAIEDSNGNEVNVFFNQSNDELGDSVTVTVVETTKGGVVSDPATIRVYVSPFVISISGPDAGVASGAWTMNYSVIHDEGATYEWSVFDHTATVTPDASGGVAITWDLSATDITGGVRCVKTYKELQSIPATFSTDLKGYCPLNDLNDLAGTWTGDDSEGNATQVVTFVDGSNFMINGLNVGWMVGYWGEVIVDQVPLVMIMNENGTLEIELQYYMETTWGGAPQPTYSIAATGYWDNCHKTMVIDYDLYQGGSVLTSITENITLLP